MDRLDREFPLSGEEFPLSGSPPPAQSQPPQTTNPDLDDMASGVELLARAISHHQARHDRIRNRRERISPLLERYNELRHQNRYMQSPEMNQLESEMDDVIFEQRTQYTPRNPRSIPRPVPRPIPRLKPREPARTLVPLLPVPSYREQDEAEFERSLEYVQVQVKILKALEENDTVLDPHTAYTWTLEIAPPGETPEPLQALRLCYYMRSHGYDTYANIRRSNDPEDCDSTIRLLLVDPKSDQRGVGYDHLYWYQDCETGEILHEPYKILRSESTAATSEHDPRLTITADDSESFMAPPVAHDGVPRLRGGEAAEHYRYSFSIKETGPTRILRDIREIIEAIEAIEAGRPQATRDTQAADVARRFQNSPRSSVSSDNSDESIPITRCPEILANMWSNTSWMLRKNFEHRNRFLPRRHSFTY